MTPTNRMMVTLDPGMTTTQLLANRSILLPGDTPQEVLETLPKQLQADLAYCREVNALVVVAIDEELARREKLLEA